MGDVKPDFGPGVYAARLVRGTIKDADVLLDRAMESGSSRPDGSGIAALDPWMRAHPNADFVYGAIFSGNLETIERLLRSCQDLAEGLALTLDANGCLCSECAAHRLHE